MEGKVKFDEKRKELGNENRNQVDFKKVSKIVPVDSAVLIVAQYAKKGGDAQPCWARLAVLPPD